MTKGKWKLSSWTWFVLWLLSLGTVSIYAKCSDGVTIHFRGWPDHLGEWLHKRKKRRDTEE